MALSFVYRFLIRGLRRGSLLLASLVLGSLLGGDRLSGYGFEPDYQTAKSKRVVIPFDFESKFDEGRYGQIVGESIWKKLLKDGRYVLPESMLDVRDWAERKRVKLSPQTPLDEMAKYMRDDFDAEIAIWGKVERAPEAREDIYDLTILIVDFSTDPPKTIFHKSARTQTVSEIPHLYVKEALAALSGDGPVAVAGIDTEAEERWRTGPNLLRGDFEQGAEAPAGWDRLPKYVSRIVAAAEGSKNNHAIRFQFPEDVAGSSGVLYYSEYFPVEEGALYRFQCRWRSTGSAVKVFIKCYDELSTEFQKSQDNKIRLDSSSERREVYRSQQNLQGPSKQWNLHTQDFTPKHTQFTPQWGRVMLYAYWPAGTVDWDDVVVKQIRPPPESTGPKDRRPSTETKVRTEEVESALSRRRKTP